MRNCSLAFACLLVLALLPAQPFATGPQRADASAAGLGAPIGAGQTATFWLDAPDPTGRPNVLIIVTDDQSFQLFNRDLMPQVFGRLVDQGVRFERGYVNNSLCCPSRATILTGLYSHHTGVDTNGIELHRNNLARPTFPAALQEVGYRTMLAGKYLNSEPCAPHPGWERWVCHDGDSIDPTLDIDGQSVEFNGFVWDVLADHAIAFLEGQTAGGPPWLVYYTPRAPHLPGLKDPIYPAPPFYDPPSFNVVGDPRSRPGGDPLMREGEPPRPMSDEELESVMQDYVEMARTIPPLDAAIGRLLDVVDQRFPNTLVVFLSDNGFLYGEHAEVGKSKAYEEAHRVPFVVRYPAAVPVEQARTSSALIGNMDIAPTVMELAGVPWAGDGVSLLPLLRGEVSSVRDHVLIEACQAREGPGTVPHRCPLTIWKPYWGIVTEHFTYTEYGGGDDGRELYDLRVDPFQMHNLAMPDPDPAVVTEWSARLQELVAGRPLPDTTVALGPGNTAAGGASFEVFTQSMASRLECRLSGPGQAGDWQRCPTGRAAYTGLAPGEYTFEARATDTDGDQDPTPAARRFVVP